MIRHDAVLATARRAQRLSCPPISPLRFKSCILYSVSFNQWLQLVFIILYSSPLNRCSIGMCLNYPRGINLQVTLSAHSWLIDWFIHWSINWLYKSSKTSCRTGTTWKHENMLLLITLCIGHRTLSWGRLQLNRKQGRKRLSRMSHIKRTAPPEQQNRTMEANWWMLEGLKSLKILQLTGHAMFLYVPMISYVILGLRNVSGFSFSDMFQCMTPETTPWKSRVATWYQSMC